MSTNTIKIFEYVWGIVFNFIKIYGYLFRLPYFYIFNKKKKGGYIAYHPNGECEKIFTHKIEKHKNYINNNWGDFIKLPFMVLVTIIVIIGVEICK